MNPLRRGLVAASCLLLALAAGPRAPAAEAAAGEVAIVGASRGTLSAAAGERVAFTVRTARAGELDVSILSPDRDVVRTIRLGPRPAGEHAVDWDGRDDAGRIVPDEAYVPRAELAAGGSRFVDDPIATTGGEVLQDLQAAIVNDGDIAYTLPAPGRVLVRVGVKGGAMMRSLAAWAPRPAGRNVQRWNGYDESGAVDLRTPRLAILVTAFRLPAFSVLVSGGGPGYRDYRLARGWPERPEASVREATEQPAERNGVRIARQHTMPRYKDRDPRITVALATREGVPLDPAAPLPDLVRVSVDLHPDDHWLLEESLYEVAYFVDGDFVSEEENGYVPIAWLWNTTALAPGPHQLTVNLTGFTGRVGTRTIPLTR